MQNKPLVGGLRNRALKLDFAFYRHVLGQIIRALGYKNRPPVRRRISRLERRTVVGRPIPQCAVVAHVDDRQHIADKIAGHIFNDDIVQPDQTTAGAGQINPEMPVGNPVPDHVNAGAVSRRNDRFDFDDFAIGRQLCARANHRQTCRLRAPRQPGPARNPHRGHWACDSFHFSAHLQITARQQRRFAHIANLCHSRGFQNFQRAAKILIRRHKYPVTADRICIGPRRAIAARPDAQTCRKRQRCQDDPISNRFVHE